MSREIKKTMVLALAAITALEGKEVTAAFINSFTEDFCVKSSRTGASEPRESVKLFDNEGGVIGRRCSVLKVWLAPNQFNGDVARMSISREANKVKTANLREAEKLIKTGDVIRLEAKELTDPSEKLAKFEEYDIILEQAQAIKSKEITIDDVNPADDIDFIYFDTPDALAEDLGVDVILEAPKKEAEQAEQA